MKNDHQSQFPQKIEVWEKAETSHFLPIWRDARRVWIPMEPYSVYDYENRVGVGCLVEVRLTTGGPGELATLLEWWHDTREGTCEEYKYKQDGQGWALVSSPFSEGGKS